MLVPRGPPGRGGRARRRRGREVPPGRPDRPGDPARSARLGRPARPGARLHRRRRGRGGTAGRRRPRRRAGPRLLRRARPSSPTSPRTPPSPRRRSSARCCRSSRTPTRRRRCAIANGTAVRPGRRGLVGRHRPGGGVRRADADRAGRHQRRRRTTTWPRSAGTASPASAASWAPTATPSSARLKSLQLPVARMTWYGRRCCTRWTVTPTVTDIELVAARAGPGAGAAGRDRRLPLGPVAGSGPAAAQLPGGARPRGGRPDRRASATACADLAIGDHVVLNWAPACRSLLVLRARRAVPVPERRTGLAPPARAARRRHRGLPRPRRRRVRDRDRRRRDRLHPAARRHPAGRGGAARLRRAHRRRRGAQRGQGAPGRVGGRVRPRRGRPLGRAGRPDRRRRPDHRGRPGAGEGRAGPARSARPTCSSPARTWPSGSGALCDGRGADHAIECVGRADTIRAAWSSTRRGGHTTVVGMGAATDQLTFNALEIAHFARTLQGCMYGSADPAVDIGVPDRPLPGRRRSTCGPW